MNTQPSRNTSTAQAKALFVAWAHGWRECWAVSMPAQHLAGKEPQIDLYEVADIQLDSLKSLQNPDWKINGSSVAKYLKWELSQKTQYPWLL